MLSVTYQETLKNSQTILSGRKHRSLPAAEWYEQKVTTATTEENVRTSFITSFSNGRNKFRYRMEVEQCVRGDGEKMRNLLHRIKRTVKKNWPYDMNGNEAEQKNAERDVQAQQTRQINVSYSLKILRPRSLQREAQENLM